MNSVWKESVFKSVFLRKQALWIPAQEEAGKIWIYCTAGGGLEIIVVLSSSHECRLYCIVYIYWMYSERNGSIVVHTVHTQTVTDKLPPSWETFQGTYIVKKALSHLAGPADHNMSEVEILLPPGVVFVFVCSKEFWDYCRILLTVYALFFHFYNKETMTRNHFPHFNDRNEYIPFLLGGQNNFAHTL